MYLPLVTWSSVALATPITNSKKVQAAVVLISYRFQFSADTVTGGLSSSCEMIILRNNSHGGIIRVCMGIFTTAQRNKKIRQILKTNTSPYFHSVLLVIWLLTLIKRTHFSKLSISRFSTYTRKGQGWTLHFRTPDLRSKKFQRKMTGRPQIQRRIQAHILQFHFNSLQTQSSSCNRR